ncbi:hypothetical protein BD410DRAFT_840942 [Rickenella mellea]|uniref:PEHE domain-containing protein n=1 Tax=Rickenella mellea TaxID=50990 RepID=A0A4Y7Q284_9AGAM|nr:hypothetical protein BD410DRAFT_840942 [Rickenella mellea]
MAAFPTPSSKALGKRPAKSSLSTHELIAMDVGEDSNGIDVGETISASANLNARQKRVLPSRSRRGGPGVGGCDVDMNILEVIKRKGDNDPLIPSNSVFLLTTDSSLVQSSPSSSEDHELLFNYVANERYFDRPDVIQSIKGTQVIQVPEFVNLADEKAVGGRLRARGEEVGEQTTIADTSDAAYEKRHRKYETFEKRVRVREKEKLKHEHYKLKERIEQLRAMDSSSFMALPAAAFFPGEENSTSGENALPAELPGAHVNGAAVLNEGERRRRKMMDVAMNLEERYRVLLPDTRKGPAISSQLSLSASVEPEPEPEPEPQEEVENEEGEVEREQSGEEEVAEREEEVDQLADDDLERPVKVLTSSRGRPIKLKLSLQPRGKTPKEPSIVPQLLPTVAPTQRKRGRPSKQPPVLHSPLAQNDINDQHVEAHPAEVPAAYPSEYISIPPSDPHSFPIFPTSISAPPQANLPTSAPPSEDIVNPMASVSFTSSPPAHRSTTFDESSPMQSPQKKPKKTRAIGMLTTSASQPNIRLIAKAQRQHSMISTQYSISGGEAESPSHGPGRRPPPMPAILVAASRNADIPNARKTSRNFLAFGVKPPKELEDMRDFQLPDWVHYGHPDEGSDSDGEASDAHGPVKTPTAHHDVDVAVEVAGEGGAGIGDPTDSMVVDDASFEQKDDPVPVADLMQDNLHFPNGLHQEVEAEVVVDVVNGDDGNTLLSGSA